MASPPQPDTIQPSTMARNNWTNVDEAGVCMGILLPDDLGALSVIADGKQGVDKRQRRLRQVSGVMPSLFRHEMIRFSALDHTQVVIPVLLEGGEQPTGIDRCCISSLFKALPVRALGSLGLLGYCLALVL
jgi:hypothetical protein